MKEDKMYIPVIGALALAVGTVLEKVVLKRKKIDYKLYHVAVFLGMICLI
ncbi:hypothetical protein ACFL0X_01745 [Nanoarchaeota archaeon]